MCLHTDCASHADPHADADDDSLVAELGVGRSASSFSVGDAVVRAKSLSNLPTLFAARLPVMAASQDSPLPHGSGPHRDSGSGDSQDSAEVADDDQACRDECLQVSCRQLGCSLFYIKLASVLHSVAAIAGIHRTPPTVQTTFAPLTATADSLLVG
jgi:hypothetical protein